MTEAVSDLPTRADLAELRADLYRALWLEGAAIVATVVALVRLLP